MNFLKPLRKDVGLVFQFSEYQLFEETVIKDVAFGPLNFGYSQEEAVKMGAECQFIERYPDVVTVYKIGDVSLEICGGPHVSNTSELGKFILKKEEASSAGVRRIKAILEK